MFVAVAAYSSVVVFGHGVLHHGVCFPLQPNSRHDFNQQMM
jgi:hypothetical protein